MKSIFNSKRGFTLVELLIGMTIIVFIGIIVVGIITSTLRGSNKTNVITVIRQNGNYAILQMSKMIAYAKSFDSVFDGVTNVKVCEIPPAITHYKSVTITSFDDEKTTFSCNDSGDLPPNTIASNSASTNASLIDTDSVSLPTPIPTFCFFTCSQGSIADAPTIGINFTLTQKGTSAFVEKQATVPFETSVAMRNLGK